MDIPYMEIFKALWWICVGAFLGLLIGTIRGWWKSKHTVQMKVSASTLEYSLDEWREKLKTAFIVTDWGNVLIREDRDTLESIALTLAMNGAEIVPQMMDTKSALQACEDGMTPAQRRKIAERVCGPLSLAVNPNDNGEARAELDEETGGWQKGEETDGARPESQ